MINTPSKLAVGLLALVLAGCTTAPTAPVVDIAQTQRRAIAEQEAGNFAVAAELYRTLASASTGSTQAGYFIESARLEVALRNYARAGQLLGFAEQNAASEQRPTIEILRSRIELAQGMPTEALARVERLGESSGDLLVDVLDIRGRAQLALERPVDAIRSLTERELWLDDINAILGNQRLMWDAFRADPPLAATPTGDPTVDGWLELGRIAGVTLEDERRRELIQWRTRNNQHPAARVLLTDLLLDELADFPRQIALLLPLSTTARENALAIRDGFLAAHMAARRDALVRIYDTGQEGATAAYVRAQIDGADFIVGPLLRNDVEAVIAQAGLVPTLALNYTLTESPRVANIYEFALAPEDEARAIARYALAQGQRHAVALIESSDRGYRIYNSFRSEFELGGGEVLSIMGYDQDVGTYSSRITALMNIDRSNQRYRRLAANLGTDVAFEPRRRQDVDMIFLAANANFGRLLAPQLEYYYAGNVPTYAISEIFDPRIASETRDLDRLIFPEVPWLITPSNESVALRSTITQYWPMRDSAVPRYYGFGLDAYAIVETLYSEPFFSSILGASGLLTMDLDGRIHRSLPFARIRNGRPEPIAELPATTGAREDLPVELEALGLPPPIPSTNDTQIPAAR